MRYGDNYYHIENNEWHQRRNLHHEIGEMEKDLSGENVLVCNKFWYFGRDAKTLPKRFHGIVKSGPGHKIIDYKPTVDSFWTWLNEMDCGLQGQPFLAKHDATIGCTQVAE